MSTEWTIVNRNKRNFNVDKEHIVPHNMRGVNNNNIQKKENDRRKRWEQKREKKIAEYNAEFPLLPGSKDLVSDATKIAYINSKIATRKKVKHHKEYKHEEKAKRNTANTKHQIGWYEIAEKLHVQEMIEKWGAHRWHRCVAYTEDDCDTAERLRDEEELCELHMEQYERELELEWEEKELIRKAEKEKYIAEQTANMSEEQKRRWIINFEYDEEIKSDYAYEAAGDAWYKERKKIEQEDKERLDRWNEKQLKINKN
jgi:hypothetical protein